MPDWDHGEDRAAGRINAPEDLGGLQFPDAADQFRGYLADFGDGNGLGSCRAAMNRPDLRQRFSDAGELTPE
jgi:hypothetical protein